VTLLAAVTIMLIMMAAAVPSWRYVMKNDREEELIFRGGEIADAIARYQQRNGNALPVSLEVLVKGKFLRREYKDPMTKDGKWRFIRPGEQVGAIRPPGSPGGTSGPGSSPSSLAFSSPSGARRSTGGTTRSSSFSQPGTTMGAIQGVASTSDEESLRVFNGRTKYNEWLFLPGQPRDVGRPTRRAGVPGARPGMPGQPGLRPGTRPGVPPPPGPSPGLPGAVPPPPRRQ
jgi:type II secretory pathway pseudopilin PulG